MRKSLHLQAEMMEEFGACVFDVTLDCEDGAPVGGEVDHANMVVALTNQAQAAAKKIAKAVAPRSACGCIRSTTRRSSPTCDIVVKGAGAHLAYIMITQG